MLTAWSMPSRADAISKRIIPSCSLDNELLPRPHKQLPWRSGVSAIVPECTERVPRPEVRVDVGPTGCGPYAAVIDLCGEHDLATVEAVTDALSPFYGDVLVDLSSCDFMDSTVIGVLIRKAQELEREGHRLELVVPRTRANVLRVFATIRMGDLITIHECTPVAKVAS